VAHKNSAEAPVQREEMGTEGKEREGREIIFGPNMFVYINYILGHTLLATVAKLWGFDGVRL